MCYLPLSYLAALHIFHVSEKQKILNNILRISILIVGVLFSAVFFTVPFLLENKAMLLPYIKDEFAQEALLNAPEIDSTLKWLGVFYLGMFLIIMLVHMKRHVLQGVIRLGLLNMLFLSIYLHKVVPEIEAVSQRPAIEFFKELRGQDVYVNVIGYKSYAHYFYFRQNPMESHQKTLEWQLNGDIDKPVYLVTRIDRLAETANYPELKEVKRSGGFILLVRNP